MSTYTQTFLTLNLLVIVIALGFSLADPAALLIDTIKRHARNAVLKQALAGRISWCNALPLLNRLAVRS